MLHIDLIFLEAKKSHAEFFFDCETEETKKEGACLESLSLRRQFRRTMLNELLKLSIGTPTFRSTVKGIRKQRREN